MRSLLWRWRDAAQFRFRARRYALIARELPPPSGSGWTLDLGGGPASFFSGFVRERSRIVLLDLSADVVASARRAVPWIAGVVARGEALPFADRAIDLTVCNSVIEHADDPAALAAEIRRVSQRYFVQTPSAGFPFEMHSPLPIPGYRWLPGRRLRRLVARLCGADIAYLERVRYLDAQEMRALFPGAVVRRERILGLTKSVYAISR